MKLIWTKSSLPLSIGIRWLFNEPVSHFGIVFDNGIVFHSNLMGTHIEWYKTFLKHCEVVYEIEYELTLEQQEQIYLNILDTYDDKGYDYKAFCYFGYRGFLLKFLNKPLPKTNMLNDKNKFLCTELASTLPDYIISTDIKQEDLSIITPFSLYNQIVNKKVNNG